MAGATQEWFRVKAHEIDAFSRISISSLLFAMQEVAWNNAEELGASIYQLQARNISWVLSRLKLELYQRPQHRDRYQVETYPAGQQRSLVYRDYVIRGEDLQTRAAAYSTWIVFDMEARKMISIPADLQPLVQLPPGKEALERQHARLRMPADQALQSARVLQIRRADLDPNQHVSNQAYLTWIMEALPDALYQQGKLRSIDLHFKAECDFQKEVIVKNYQLEANRWLHQIWLGEEKELVRAETQWEQG
ncbi:MAG: acyl-ACP thioesterase domain-containing protein [Bacteroidota bacterium]